jgi:hypothetical protein
LNFRGGDVPRFLVRPQPLFRGWLSDLLAVLQPASEISNPANGRLRGSLVESRAQLPRHALFASLLFHSGVIACLVQLPQLIRWPLPASQAHPIAEQHLDGAPLIYHVVPVQIAQSLPALHPPGPGGRPGKGVLPDRLPSRGSSVFHVRTRIVSSPARPDNPRQTIVQPNTPPDLRIAQDLRLPNILSGSLAGNPKLEAKVKLSAPRAAAHRNEAVQAPEYVAVPQDPSISSPSPIVAQPRLPIPVASSLAAPKAHAGPGSSAEGVAGADTSDAAAGGLLVVSVDPAARSLAALPPGNRFGGFSISPSGGLPGSPGGVLKGDVQAGSGGPGTGGDSSVGVGSEETGGGGGGAGFSGDVPVSIAGGSFGTTGSASAAVLADGVLAPNIVFAVPMQAALRKRGLVFSTGPVGGAGLNVYGVLRCGKIYTMYLAMPGKDWVLEYCVPGAAETGQKPPNMSGQITMHADAGLAAPAIEERFDFKRSPVPANQADELTILRGAIEKDGTVTGVAVYQGVVQETDLGACAAFARWKFKPALREGKPTRVEILVGIPATVPQ